MSLVVSNGGGVEGRLDMASRALGRAVNANDSEVIWNAQNAISDEGFTQYLSQRFGYNPYNASIPEISGDFWGGLAGAAKGFVTGGIGGAIGGAISGSKGGPPAPPAPPGWGTGGMGTGIGGAIGGALIPEVVKRLGGGTSSGTGMATTCGCNGGRDSCTGQKLSSQPAPLATFFGGCCPPGRVLRRINNGRDICIKKPRMNVLNPYALRRADRRVKGFANTAKKMLSAFGYKVGPRKLKATKARRRSR